MPHKRGQKRKLHPYMDSTHPQMQAIHPMSFMNPNFMGMMHGNMAMMQPMLPPNMPVMNAQMPMMQHNMPAMQHMLHQNMMGMMHGNMPMMHSMMNGNMPMQMMQPGMMMPQVGSIGPFGGPASTASAPLPGNSASMVVASSSASAPIVTTASSSATVSIAPSAASVPSTHSASTSSPNDDILECATIASNASEDCFLEEEEEAEKTEIVQGNPKHCGMYLPGSSEADDVVPIQISKASTSKAAAKPTDAKAGRKNGSLNKATVSKLKRDAEEWANKEQSSEEPATRRTSRRQGGSTRDKVGALRQQNQQKESQPKATRNSKSKQPDFGNEFSEDEDDNLEYY
ncbi:uncharacterized protein LOC117653162 [Thrips palmi]|uniref:Uncharacterized protein LOC117653162 n=1 Tax=Thrips palmi TaxID=161013 RepID=A0A6P9A906_THRPL|nr:uncharacterized protein LOC117653162 [Thrips palmi]